MLRNGSEKWKIVLAAVILAAAMGAGAVSAYAVSSSARSSAATKAGKRSKRRVKRERGQRAPTADRIVEIQQALAKEGSYKGTPNGKWDAATIEGMRKFQLAHGLNPTGKLDALTLQKMGLGSEITGVAAPLPPLNVSSSAPQTARP
jgi:peptidoglycan hydrolase-like protein with peptidoglycan-binding domain